MHHSKRTVLPGIVFLLATIWGLACAAGRNSREPESPAFGATFSDGSFLSTDSVRLFYHVVGVGPDTAVVVHGGPGFGIGSLSPDLDRLATGRVLIYYDQRGGGRSTLIADTSRLSIKDHVTDLAAVIRHFQLRRPTLIGHSWGALLVTLYAATHPTEVGPLVLLEPAVPKTAPYFAMFNKSLVARATPDELEAFSAASSPATLASDPLGGCRVRMAILMRLWGGADSVRDRVRADLCAMSPEAYRSVQEYTVPGANLSLQDADYRSAAAAVASPVLIVEGLADPIPVRAFEEWREAFHNVTLLKVKGAGHFAHAERPDMILPIIDAFLRRSNARATQK